MQKTVHSLAWFSLYFKAPPKVSQGPLINANSITGIGLLGSYADDSDEENAAETTAADSSQAEHKPSDEIDTQLADFFKV